jgi:hypothetical protein
MNNNKMSETTEMINILEGYLNEKEKISLKEYNRLLLIISNIKREIMHGTNFVLNINLNNRERLETLKMKVYSKVSRK